MQICSFEFACKGDCHFGMVLGAAKGEIPSAGSGALAKDLQDLLDIIPLDKVIKITREYLLVDVQLKTLVKLAQSAESRALIRDVEARPELKELLDFVQEKGVDIYYLVGKVNEAVGLAPLVPSSLSEQEIIGGFEGYVLEVLMVLPVSELEELFHDKLNNSQVFKETWAELTSPRYLELYNSVARNTHFHKLTNIAKKAGVNEDDYKTYYPLSLAIAAALRALY
ncbi:Protein G12 [Habropoda laboriosa]|uniref:Protein G12 n=1 Tax=Habropoda laboriosa TaxID=597456 RepID=A0A0L7R8C5_9HYME|nr:Protein G12 [Habropoda laboriosa]